MEKAIELIVQRYNRNKKEGLIPILQEIQQDQGFLTEESLADVSDYLRIPLNKVYGVATFYDQFHFSPRGQYHIQLCRGTTCHLSESAAILKEIEKQLKVKAGSVSRDRRFSLELMSCMGSCNLSPIMKVNDTYYSQVSMEEASKIIRSLKEKTL